MAREYADKGFASVFVYTREVHPGEHFPALCRLEQKLAHARFFAERYGIARPILVDDLAGTGHHLYGLLPNMTYLVSRAGRVLFRADWTDPPTIRAALDYVVESRARRREGWRLKPFYVESVGYRWSDTPKFQEGLALAGPQAVEDFARAIGLRPDFAAAYHNVRAIELAAPCAQRFHFKSKQFQTSLELFEKFISQAHFFVLYQCHPHIMAYFG